jgi:DNA helicase-2/ATP-dependent DNA helicase PcrA
MTPFDSSYARLNRAQKEAVDSIDGPVMVIAGPGTGKTTILTLRIANILKQTDTPPHGILAITYTDAGVKAMRQKLRDIIGNRAHEVAIHTFHSFASAMIAEYQDHFLHLEGLRHMNEVEQESLVRTIIAQPRFTDIRPIGKPDAYIPSIMSSIDAAKREALTPEMVRQHAAIEIQHIKSDEDSISTRGVSKGKLKAEALDRIEKCEKTLLFTDVYEEYEKKKRENKRMDFNDLIIELLVALRNDQLLLRLIQERFLYLLVDEHQDTNDAQNFIIGMIAEFFETPNIFIVGDEKQAIYRFQGASVENFLLLQKRWPSMKVISLDTNYRSHQSILDASFSMIENNYEGDEHKDLRIELKSGNKEKPHPIEIVTGENVAAIEAYLVEQLKAIIGMSANSNKSETIETHGKTSPVHGADDNRTTPTSTIAIITRRNRDLERVLRLLESNGIPVSSERSVDIFHHPIGVAFFDLIEYLNDPSKNEPLGRTLAAGMWGLKFEDSAALIRMLHSGRTADLDNKIPGLLHLQRKMLNDGAVGFLIHAAEESGFTGLVARDPAYIHVWRGIVALAESLAREGDVNNPSELIKAMLAYRLSAESKTVKVSVGAPDLPIQAMTAHGSKGLEFDYVFMSYATEEAWVGRPRGSSFVLPEKKAADHDIRDTRRLFYVALTRAKKHAVILSTLEESDGKALTPLRFINELDQKSVKTVELPRLEIGLPEPAPISIKGEPVDSPGNSHEHHNHDGDIHQAGSHSTKIVGLAKHVLLDTGLSVTALNHFIKCPNEFLYESILKLPQAPSAAAEKGTAMHEAISRVWQDKERLKFTLPRPLGDNSVPTGATLPVGRIAAPHVTLSSPASAAHIQSIIVDAISGYFDSSFLPVNEKEAVKKGLLEDAPAVAKALQSHFNAKGPVFTERWVRTTFDGVFTSRNSNKNGLKSGRPGIEDTERISIPIHGKLDAIVESADEVEVFDYKTRQAMSVNAIKGGTKDSTGDYFRQLIFYKLLLQSEPRWRSRRITPALVFVSPDDKGRCPIISLPILPEDIEAVKRQIQSVIDSVWSGEIANTRCEERECEWCGLRSLAS